MGFYCLSVRSRRSGLASLEKLPTPKALELTRHLLARLPGGEGVPLRTCNRFELYFWVPQAWDARFAARLRRLRLAPRQEFLQDEEVVEHLYSVAAGLDSELIGEDEILGQIRNSYRDATEQGWTGREMAELFERALHAGRRVRHETALNKGVTSLSRLAIHEARRTLPQLEKARVGIFGSGQMGEKILGRLLKEGVTQITVSARTEDRRKALEAKWPVRAIPPGELVRHLGQLDAIFCAIESQTPLLVLSPETVHGRTGPLAIVDLGVPSNVRRKGRVSGVRVTDMRQLRDASRRISRGKARSIQEARGIVRGEVELFRKNREERDVARFAERLLAQAEKVAGEERTKARTLLNGSGNVDVVLQNLSSSLIKRLLLPSIVSLKNLSPPERTKAIEVAQRLFLTPSSEE